MKTEVEIKEPVPLPLTPTPCEDCNGELVKAMLVKCTPTQIAHAYVHTEAQVGALVRRVEILGRMLEKATGWTLAEIAEQVAAKAEWR